MIKRALSRTIKLTLFWSLLSIGLPLQAEDLKVVITGKVVGQSNEPLPYANVFVIQNNEVAENTVTDDLGKFELTAKSGKYALGVSYIGYKMVIQEIDTTSGSHLDLGTIVLEEDTEVLQTVVVMGEAVRVKTLPNGFSVNVDRLRETSNDAFDLLRRLPQIQVKGTELNVVGKQNVVVQIGNVVKRVPASELSSVLKGFDAGLIDQVEVLMQPPLRYDPDGNTAMIILHTNSVFKEYMGGVIGTEIMEGERKNDRYGGYASLIYNRKKLYWSVAPAYNYNTSTMREDVKYIFPDRSYQLLTPSEGSSAYAGINATLQYQYNNRGHLGLTTSVNNRKVESFFESSERHAPKQYERFDANTLNDYNSKKPKVDATAYIEQEFGSNNKVWLELSYFNYTDRSHNKFSSKYSSDTQEYLKYEDNDHITVSGWGANNDYSLSLDSDGKYKIDTGLKALFTSTSNNRNHSQWMYENSDETFEQKGYPDEMFLPITATDLIGGFRCKRSIEGHAPLYP